MIEVSRSAVIPAPAQRVWALVRDFNAMPEWNATIRSSTIEDGPADRIGCRRVLTFDDGSGWAHELTALSDAEMTIAYAIVGMPPVSWLHRSDASGPPEIRVQSFSFDAPFTAEPHRLLLWTSPGVVVQTTAGDVKFLVARGEGPDVRRIDSILTRARIAQSRAYEREVSGSRAPLPRPTVYVTHVVRSGESVISIARHYRTTPDVIRQLNRLTTDRIRIGERLRVPQVSGAADSAAAP